jgi:hypothetical protein
MTSEQHTEVDPIDPEDARRNPEQAVDAMEDRILGDSNNRLDGRYPDDAGAGDGSDDAAAEHPDDTGDDDRADSAFQVDLDPEEQGSAEAGASNPD